MKESLLWYKRPAAKWNEALPLGNGFMGAMCFASMQMLQHYEGGNLIIRRLRRIMLVSDVLFLFTAVLMFANQGNSLGLDWIYYLNYVKNNWVVLLLLAAILQLYTTFRIDHELEKEAKNK